MNAVIVDLKGRYAAALNTNGEVVKILNQGYAIGQQIALNDAQKKRTFSMAARRAGASAAAIAVIATAGSATAYAMPYGTVSIQDNASGTAIECTINCFDYVLDINAQDDAGASVLESMDTRHLRHRNVRETIAELIEQIEIEDGDAGMEFGTEFSSVENNMMELTETDGEAGLLEEKAGLLEETTGRFSITAETKSSKHTERLQNSILQREKNAGFTTETATQEDALNKTMPEEPTKNQAVENQAVENQAVENQAVENQAVENQAVENQTVENQVIENQTINQPQDLPNQNQPADLPNDIQPQELPENNQISEGTMQEQLSKPQTNDQFHESEPIQKPSEGER